MRILITNDDGIIAPGLTALYEIASKVAGKDGEVWTVAPAFEQSGVGHCISYARPAMLVSHGKRRFAVEGTPADCVLAGMFDVMDGMPDLVLSGVNKGNNSGENTLYSGTIGAAMEAALQGVKAIALSQYFGPGNAKLDDPFETARKEAPDLIVKLLEHGGWDDADYRLFYNVNFPPVAAKDAKGPKVVTQGFRHDVTFGVTPQLSPTGRRYLWVHGGAQHTPTLDGSDVHANLNGYTSVTPMRADLTDHALLQQLRDKIG
ncbi:5'-nucleotidase /3'-nucleotidase /exopolyphosphatase [Cognatiyoonia koreensis]|uniref:5'-nucleotidase SurE n=1 Tax=Cognatiyoonia koreensis TaxID=364200 RepID=A0A1I0PT43_9RHOB|nr:5'/3'-nucleotidase SurE [Cognatiyoonia koreensis]SEW17578.1 5'-nucleotidase /3'-nucleotidase /exopolyphosphatase [Cognatiyoonia koreensis]